MKRFIFIAWLAFFFLMPLTAFAQDLLPIVSITASADDGNVATNVIDGDLSTRWSASGDGQWLKLDLGEVKAVDQVEIAWYRGDKRSALFDIEASEDGTAWTLLYAGQSTGATLHFETFNFASTPARYLRYVGHGNSSNMWNSITEIAVRGAVPPPEPPILRTATVGLAWDATAQQDMLDGFRLYYSPVSGVYSKFIELGVVTQTTIEVPVLADTMYFVVTAFKGDLESSYSNEVATDMRQPEIIIDPAVLGGVEVIPDIQRTIGVLQKVIEQLETQ